MSKAKVASCMKLNSVEFFFFFKLQKLGMHLSFLVMNVVVAENDTNLVSPSRCAARC